MSAFGAVGSVAAGLAVRLMAVAGTITLPRINYTAILPELILMGGALVVVTVASLIVRQPPTGVYAISTAAIASAALVTSIVLWHDVTERGPFVAIDSSIAVDGFGIFFLVLVCVALVLASLVGEGYLRREGIAGPEYYVLALLSGSGAMLMAVANDLIVIFLGLEILSIALYVLAGMNLRRRESGEAAMKYFVLGAFSSAIFVYGIALTYGATGSTNLTQIASYLAHNVLASNGVLLAGLALLLVGFGFKIAGVPFHMWTPDVYQGSPTPVVGFMASVAKAAGFAGLLRVFYDSFRTFAYVWQPMVWVLAALTLLVGAVVALVQRDIKRMLAYSSINHAGFVLIGFQAATTTGIAGSLYYLFAYSLIVIGSFAVISVVGGRGDGKHGLEAYRGLGARNPWLAVAFTVLLLAQAGVPFTTGFLAKFYVLAAAVSGHSYALAVIAMVSATVAVFFYLRVVFLMFARPADAAAVADEVIGDVDGDTAVLSGASRPLGALSGAVLASGGGVGVLATAEIRSASPTVQLGIGTITVPATTALAIFCSVGATVLFGVWPQPLFDFAHAATLLF